MPDRRDIGRVVAEEVLRHLPAEIMVVEAPSGESILDNRRTQRMSERYLGRSELSGVGDLRGLHDRGVFGLFRPDGRPYGFEEWPVMRTITSGEEVRDEDVIQVMADGTRLTIRCNSSPIYDEEGRVVAGVLVTQDITEQKRAEAEQRRMVDIVQNSSDFMGICDLDWQVIFVNDAGQRMVGLGGIEEVRRTRVTDYFAPEDLARVGNEMFATVLEEGRWKGELALRHFETGEPIPVLWDVFRLDDPETGEPANFATITRDITGRKRAEETLRRSEKRFRLLVDGVRDYAIYMLDPEGHIESWNEGARRIKGYSQDEILGQHFSIFYPLEDVERGKPERGLREAETRGVYEEEGWRVRKDGSRFWASVLITALKDEAGHLRGFAKVTRDITERMQAEEALGESSRRIENILESITEAFLVLDREWRISYLNGQTLRRFRQAKGEELTREDLMGKNNWEVFPDVVGTEVYEKYHEAMREQKFVRFETYYPPTAAWYEANLYPSEEGLAIYSPDITERKRAEEELETRNRQQAAAARLGMRALERNDGFQALMDEAVTLVAEILGVEYAKIVELLPGGEELLLRAGVGWEEELVGIATESVGRDSEAGYTLLFDQPVVMEDLRTEDRFVASELVRGHSIVSGMTVVIPGREEPFGVLCAHATSRRTFSQDDTHFLQSVANVLAAAIERQVTDGRLEEVREAERSRIARDLHDEALQDLAGAMAEAQLARRNLLREPREEQRLSERLDRLSAALGRVEQRVRGAVHDLRLEGEQDRPLSGLLESLVELHLSLVPELDIRLEVGDGLLDRPLGDTDRQLIRVVGEALTNARRHSGASSVRVAVWTSGGRLFAEVEDDGRGFDPATHPPATSAGGVGIRGMRERARAIGGVLRIESEPAMGTRVRFEMPLQRDTQKPENKVRILLVEDHATVRDALVSAFEQEGEFEITGQAGSLAEARAMLGEIEVAVVDLGLPDGYGGDLIKDLGEANPRAQAIVLSASLDRAEIARAVEAGAAGVLNKTASLEEVVEAVRRLRAGETLMPLEEVVELLRFAGERRQQQHGARQLIARLTPREREVLQALAEGLDSRQIAERLHISVRTERNHMASILAKLEVHSQLQALVFALRHSVVELP